MIRDTSYYKNMATQLLSDNQNRDAMFERMDRLYRADYDLHKEVARMEWIHKVVSTDPHDAVRTGTRTLSALDPATTVHPLANDPDNRAAANKLEQALKWQFMGASFRRRTNVLSDMVMSAILYDSIAVQVVSIPYQLREEQALKGADKRLSYATRHGNYALNVFNPRNVYPLENMYGLAGVLAVQTKRVHEVVTEWGKRADALLGTLKADKKDASANQMMQWVTVYDWWDLDVRYVWAVPGGHVLNATQQNTADIASPAGGVDIVEPYAHGFGWLPWVVRQGGTTMQTEPEHRLIPLLYSVDRTKQWETQNIADTLAVSEMIYYASAPRSKHSGPNPSEGVRQSFGEPGNAVEVSPGHDYQPLPPPTIDTGLLTIVDRITQRIGKSSGVNALQGQGADGGTAFATLNLATQIAVGSLKPYKALAEMAVADVLTNMLMWVVQEDQPLYSGSLNKRTRGEQYVIRPDEIDPAAIYIDVELMPDVPTDRLQRLNGAKMLQSMGMSVRDALEDAGITDVDKSIEDGYFDQMVQAEIANQLKLKAAEVDLQIEEMRIALQMQIEQGLQAQQQGAQGAPPQGFPPQQPFPQQNFPPEGMGQPNPFEQGLVEGQDFVPAEGGLPPAVVDPSLTREGASGRDRAGREV